MGGGAASVRPASAVSSASGPQSTARRAAIEREVNTQIGKELTTNAIAHALAALPSGSRPSSAASNAAAPAQQTDLSN